MLASVTAELAGSVPVSVVAGLLPSDAAASFSTGVSVVTGVSAVVAGLLASLADGVAANSAWKAWMACSKAALSLFGLDNWSKRASKRSNTASLAPLSCNCWCRAINWL